MRVLLVEDDKAVAKSIEMMLKSEGYIVDLTDLGEDGLEIGKIYEKSACGKGCNTDPDPVGPVGTG